MKIKREELLERLESVACGLAAKAMVEQTDCFVFTDGRVHAFDDELAVSNESPLPEVEGAVNGHKLLGLLRKSNQSELDVSATESSLQVKGKGERASVRLEREILMPLEVVEEPSGWTDLPGDFAEAVEAACSCVGRDESEPQLVYLHVHPERLESCDNYQLIRWPIELDLEKPLLIRGDVMKHVAAVRPTEMAVTGGWAHFRRGKLLLSARLGMDEYPDLDEALGVEGVPAKLPDGLVDPAKLAELFAKDNIEDDRILVKLGEGRMRLEGRGPLGWYARQVDAEYEGEPASFLVSAPVLLSLADRGGECLVGDGRLRMDGGRFVYVACTGSPEED